MPNYRRNFVAGGCYFFTVNLLERQRTLLTDHIDLLRDSVRRVRRLHSFHIDVWVVLPDHLHSTAWMQPCRVGKTSFLPTDYAGSAWANDEAVCSPYLSSRLEPRLQSRPMLRVSLLLGFVRD
jgi:hypothetical protein